MTEQTGQQGMPQSLPEPDWYKNPPPWWNNAPQPRNSPADGGYNSRQPPWQGQGQPTGPSNYDIMTAINGAPERIVNAIREATKQVAPQQQAPAPQQQAPAAQQQQQNDNPPRQRTFAEKWFDLAP